MLSKLYVTGQWSSVAD